MFCVAPLLCSLIPFFVAAQPPTTLPTDMHSQIPHEPAPKAKQGQVDPPFLKSHAMFLEQIKKGPIELLLIGDSITAGWRKNREIFNTAFGKYKSANFGISGDRTQHILWRLHNGELEIHPSPRVIVLLAGINNIRDHSAEDIARGLKANIEFIRSKHPETKILLLGIFPVGAETKDPRIAQQTEKINNINDQLRELADGSSLVFLDMGPKLVAEDGRPSKDIMADGVHLTPAGYQIWADTMAPVINDMMK